MSSQKESAKSKMTVRVRRPKAIVFDILGTASKSGFLERILFPYLKSNLDTYITSHWQKKDFAKMYAKIMEQSVDFNRQEPNTPLVAPMDAPQARESLMNFINFVTENGIVAPAVTQLRFKVWFEGYQQSKLHTPIYGDVPTRIRQWFSEGIKFHVFSNTWVEAQKALLRNTNHGDLTNLITGHYDNEFGSLTDPESWRKLAEEIKEAPGDVLFLTKSPSEGRAASEVGVNVVLVLTHRHNVKGLSHEDRQKFPFVRTLNDLHWVEEGQVSTNEQAPGVSKEPTGSEAGPVESATPSAASSPRSSSMRSASSRANSASSAATAATAASSTPGSSAPSRSVSNQASRSGSRASSATEAAGSTAAAPSESQKSRSRSRSRSTSQAK